MKVSVAMATYNGEQFIFKQLESIRNQILKPNEVIIFDDGSSDNTVNIIKNFIIENQLQDSWFLYKNKENFGYIKNFINAILHTTGDYVFLADQDDIFYPKKFKVMVEVMERNNKIKLLNAGFEVIDDRGKKINSMKTKMTVKRSKLKKLDFNDWLYESMFPGFSMCIHSDIRNRLKNINLSNCYGHDQLLSLIAIDMDGNYTTNIVLSGYRMHNSNATGGINLINNYVIEERIQQKEIELIEYKKLRKLIFENNIMNVEFNLINRRENILQKRIFALKNSNILAMIYILFINNSYPKRTIYGDIIFLLKNIINRDRRK